MKQLILKFFLLDRDQVLKILVLKIVMVFGELLVSTHTEAFFSIMMIVIGIESLKKNLSPVYELDHLEIQFLGQKLLRI